MSRRLSVSGMPQSSRTTPSRSLSAAPPCAGSSPSRRTLPASALARPSIRRMVVLFPAPFSPIKPMMQPAGRLKLTFSRAKPL